MRIGLISDTHGLLRPQALQFLEGCDHIVHGGDVGDAGILEALSELAPLTTVRGNNDFGNWADQLRQTELLCFGNIRLFALHDVSRLPIDPASECIDVVVYGHSHQPLVERRGRILYVNPGSAGPRRFKLPITVADLIIEDAIITPRIVPLTSDTRTRDTRG